MHTVGRPHCNRQGLRGFARSSWAHASLCDSPDNTITLALSGSLCVRPLGFACRQHQGRPYPFLAWFIVYVNVTSIIGCANLWPLETPMNNLLTAIICLNWPILFDFSLAAVLAGALPCLPLYLWWDARLQVRGRGRLLA
jgi:hypothetical protein